MSNVKRPALEGTVAVRDGRRLSFAEFGMPRGPAIVWMHGTPVSRRQIPLEARAYAEREGLRIIGIDRPGIGSSTPYLYPDILDWTARPRDPARHARRRHRAADRPVRRRALRPGRGRGAPRPRARRRRARRSGATRARTPRDGGIIQLAVRLAPLLAVGSDAHRCRPDPGDPAGPAAGRRRPRPVRRGAAARGQDLLVAPGVQGDVPRRPAQRQPVPDRGAASTTWSCSRGTGASTPPT